MKRLLALLLLAVIPVTASAQVYNKFGPATGVLKGSTSTYQTSAAAASDITGLFSGTCNSSTFLRGDNSCATPASGGTPGGVDGNVQFNSSGSFGGNNALFWDNSAFRLTINGWSSKTDPFLWLHAASGATAGESIQFDDTNNSHDYVRINYSGAHFTFGASNSSGASLDDGFDMVTSSNTVQSTTLKANGGSALGINSSGAVNVNGSSGTTGKVLTSHGFAAATWDGVYDSATSASVGGGALAAGACASQATSVASAVPNQGVVVTPDTYPGDGFYWVGYVDSFGSVTVKICSVIGGTPTASVYEIRVFK